MLKFISSYVPNNTNDTGLYYFVDLLVYLFTFTY